MRTQTLFSAKAIRDTNLHTSQTFGAGPRGGDRLFVAQNTLNQAVTVQYQGTFDGTSWHDLGSSVSVGASTGKNTQTLTDAWPRVRVTAQCASAPVSGTLTVFASARSQ